MKLFGHPDSGHVFKIRFFLEYAQIPHQFEYVDIWATRESRPLEFRQHAKFQEVPLLLDQGKAYIQSNAILIYLANKIGAHGGEDPEVMARCSEWLVWEANKIGMCLPQLRSVQRFEGHGINPGAQQWLINRYHHDIGVIEAELSDMRPFILGNQPTIADFSLSGYLFYPGETGVEVPPLVSKWVNRLTALPGWQSPYDLLMA